jgi:hypothetical protein
VDADRGDLPRRARQPDAGEPVDPLARDPEGAERSDQRLLEHAHVALDVLSVPAQVQDRVADELPRPVEGRLAAAIGLDHVDGRVLGHVQLRLVRAAAERDDGRVLEEEHGVRRLVRQDGGGDLPLQVPRFAVGDEVELEHVGGDHARSVPGGDIQVAT